MACRFQPGCAPGEGTPQEGQAGEARPPAPTGIHSYSLGKPPLAIKCQAAQLSTTGSSRLADSVRGIHKQAWMEEGWLTRRLPATTLGGRRRPHCLPGGGREGGQEPWQGRPSKKKLQRSVLPGKPGLVNQALDPGSCPCPPPERALPLLLQQHVDGPGPLAHLLLLRLLKAQVCPQQPHKISGGGTVAAGRTHCANKGCNRPWLQTLCLKNRDRLVFAVGLLKSQKAMAPPQR